LASPRNALSAPPLSLRHELVRKALHLGAAVFPLAYALGVSRGLITAVLAAVSVLAISTELLRRSSAPFAAAFDRTFGSLLREREKNHVTGATWLALSCCVAAAVLSRNAAIAALWCATVGDPAATIIGKWMNQSSAPGDQGGGKTIAGSLGCAVASFAGVWMIADYPPAIAVAIAAMAAIAESMPVSIDDNIRIVVGAGAIAQLLAG
jgi:dolichol kinase